MQPYDPSKSSCSNVSTPSAIVVRFRPDASFTIISVIVASARSVVTVRTNDWSILITSIGRRFR